MLRGFFPALGAVVAAAAFIYAVPLKTPSGAKLAAAASPDEPAPVLGMVPDFKLLDSGGRGVRSSDIKGPWIADFMFTRCPLQCPMMSSRMAALADRLPGVNFVSFSLDPADTPEVLARYARARGARWLFLTGKTGEVKRLAVDGFKLPVASSANAREPIIHSKKLVLVDAAARIRGYYDSDDEESLEALSLLARRLLPAPAGP